ncbi:MAG: hypothetical protein OXG83_08320 [Acidobacteria bacterium]|nr:hypothetical protein [Acidobacteriota bacterium]
MDAAKFLFSLCPEHNVLGFEQLGERLQKLEALKAGRLKPKIGDAESS